MRSARKMDEDDVRTRPPRRTRPRTKDRPDYSAAQSGMVIGVDRGRITCLVNGERITAMKSRELGKNAIVVGDHVGIVGDLSGSAGSLARIVTVAERRNSLTRTVDDVATIERMIVSNVDVMGIVIAAAQPEPRHGFVDRALVVAFDQAIAPSIIVTKRDLADPADFLRGYRDLGIPIYETERGADLTAIHRLLEGRVSVLLGHSGVGKSTLVNALVTAADRLTGSVNEVTGRGRHTSSSASALQLDDGSGWIIDTPGVRSFGVAHVKNERVLGAFPEFAEVIAQCPKNCSHNEGECALNNWPNFSDDQVSRLDSLRRILNGSN